MTQEPINTIFEQPGHQPAAETSFADLTPGELNIFNNLFGALADDGLFTETEENKNLAAQAIRQAFEEGAFMPGTCSLQRQEAVSRIHALQKPARNQPQRISIAYVDLTPDEQAITDNVIAAARLEGDLPEGQLDTATLNRCANSVQRALANGALSGEAIAVTLEMPEILERQEQQNE